VTERPDPRAVHSTLSKNLLRQSHGGPSSLLFATFPAGLGGVRKDAIAGITVAAIAVPQAMAYALHASRYDAGIVLATAFSAVFSASSSPS
jgi:MFS superfamily sulfate permease-like transporter